MDLDNRSWNYCSMHSHVIILNVLLGATATTGYVINEFILKPRFLSWILHGYLNDFFAIMLLLAVANLLMVRFAPFPVWRNSWLFVIIATFAAFYWEFITPLYVKSVTDPLDFIAYSLGTTFFVFLSRPARTKGIGSNRASSKKQTLSISGQEQITPIQNSASSWTDDSDPLPSRISASDGREVNALGECGRIGDIAGAEDNSRVSDLGCVLHDPK